MQAGKKKLALDHLIVQNMDEDNMTEDVQSILMFGAKALFDEEDGDSKRDIHCELRVSKVFAEPLF